MYPCPACIPPIPLYSLAVQPRPDYPLLFCREPAGCAGGLLLAGQFSAVRSACPTQLFLFRFGVCVRPSGPGFNWCAQIVYRDLVGRIFQCSDRGALLGQFGIGAQLGIGKRGIYYYIVVHTYTNLSSSTPPWSLAAISSYAYSRSWPDLVRPLDTKPFGARSFRLRPG
jgi:hypothetical protein